MSWLRLPSTFSSSLPTRLASCEVSWCWRPWKCSCTLWLAPALASALWPPAFLKAESSSDGVFLAIDFGSIFGSMDLAGERSDKEIATAHALAAVEAALSQRPRSFGKCWMGALPDPVTQLCRHTLMQHLSVDCPA